MKVLFIGVYKDGTGWSRAAIEYILALDSVGVDVVPFPLKYNENSNKYPQRIQELEKKSKQYCDAVIQNILPSSCDYHNQFKKNIALYFTETSCFQRSSWASYLNLMDELWVANTQMIEAAENSFVSTPIQIVPFPCDVSKYSQHYEPFPIPEVKDRFVFYTIGELHRRKNLVALLKAFHLEFHPQEPVALMIKGHIPNKNPIEASMHLNKMTSDVKRELKLYPREEYYHREIIITEILSDNDMMRLHNTGNCLVMPSFGETWNWPAFDAMALGKTPICTDVGGMSHFLTTKEKEPPLVLDMRGNPLEKPRYKVAGWLVPATPTPVFGMAGSHPIHIYAGNETWMDINVIALQKAMREAYENKQLRQEKAELGIDRAYDFSYPVVGQQMVDILSNKVPPILPSSAKLVMERNSCDFLRMA